MGLVDVVNRALGPVRRQVRQMITKAVIDSVTDSGGMQVLQIITGKDQVIDNVERVQQYGLTSVPASGDEAICVLVGGEREQAIVIAADSSTNRPTGLAEGEVAVYRDPNNVITFKANGDIVAECEGKIQLQASNVEIGEGTLEAIINGETFKALYDAHLHTGGFVAPTSVPTVPMTTGVHTSLSVKASK